MRVCAVILAALVLASCGVDGSPMRPTASGQVSVGTNGVRTSGTLGASNGTISVGVGF